MQKLKQLFSYFLFYYNYLRVRVLVLIVLGLIVGLLDGFGLAMFMPLMEIAADRGAKVDGENMGNLSFLINFLSANGLKIELTTVLLSMLVLFLLKGGILFLEGTYKAKLRMVFVRSIRYQMIDRIATTRFQSFTSMDAGMIQNTISGEIWRIINSFNHYFTALQSLLLLLIYIALAFLANAQFALLVAIGGVLTNFIYQNIYKVTKKFSREVTSKGHLFQSLIIQSVHYYKYLKATATYKLLSAKLKNSIDSLEQVQYKMGRLNSLVTASREPIIIVVVVLVILFQVNYLGAQLSTIILSLLFFYRSLSQLVNVQNAYNNFLNNAGALENAKSFIEKLDADREDIGVADITTQPIQQIEVKDLSFSYIPDIHTLKNISVSIDAKTTVAFVGESGSGKTTLINILTGLLDSYSGDVIINGKKLRELNKAAYQARIGYITQESVIFTDTLYNNITLWDSVTSEKVSKFEKVLKQVALWDFYGSLPDGRDTLLGDYGQKVSGGQRQRISIARELYKDIEILVMDEATSALDSETEKIVQDNIESLSGQYTLIIIAHRLSTVKASDKIVVLNKGMIDAIGSYNELVASSSRFRKMVDLQEI